MFSKIILNKYSLFVHQISFSPKLQIPKPINIILLLLDVEANQILHSSNCKSQVSEIQLPFRHR